MRLLSGIVLGVLLAVHFVSCGRVTEVTVGRQGNQPPAMGGDGAMGGGLGAAGQGTGGGGGGATGTGGGVAACSMAGASCTTGGECCSGECDEASGTCGESMWNCQDTGGSCSSSLQCCSLSCIGEVCGSSCASDGASCDLDGECCGGTCASGMCQALSLSCLTSGNGCADNAACCSGLCAAGACSLGASYCTQVDDVCADDNECCSGVCRGATGTTLGVCGEVPMGPNRCSGGVAGTVCEGCNDCCSRVCAPFGASGVSICQPAGGCRVTGELCEEDQDCCGGDPGSGLPGAGNVTCFREAGATLGVCRNPMSCSPQGAVCHYQNYICSSSAAANNCCDGDGPGNCQLDRLGVPRCSGLTGCRLAEETCSSSADCCDDVPCARDANGTFRCQSERCENLGASCSVNADCCAPLLCAQSVGQSGGVCAVRSQPPGEQVCIEFGQLCQADDCCGTVPCWEGRCQFPVK